MNIFGIRVVVTYNRIFHGIPKHYSHTVACAHAHRLQAPCEGIAFRIKAGVCQSIILMLRNDTDSRLVAFSYKKMGSKADGGNRRCSIAVFSNDMGEMVPNGGF
jgi:hypothetical protein